MTKILSLFIIIFTSIHLNAQSLSGNIINAQTGEVLPYVNIGVIGTSYGTVSGLDGTFELVLPDNEFIKDSIRFSSIGFKSQTIATKDARKQTPLQIKLEPSAIDLPEIVIKPAFTNYDTLGNNNITTKKATNLAINDRPNQNLGSAIGRKFRVNKAVYLQKFRFYIAYNNFDTVHFRINVYALSNGKPNQNINQENILITLAHHKKGWVAVDLTPYQIKVNEDFAIAAEWVYASKKGTALGLPITIPSFGAVHLYKFGSQNNWKKFPQMSSCMEVMVAW
ncbi:MAG: carboxypeptidase-like regulatory domain-containing protein [Saprospiraceae bacterium]